MVEDSSGSTAKTFRIEGARIHSIEDLYAQLNDLLMKDEDWDLGPSLDALDDVLYRFGPKSTEDRTVFVWADHEHSRDALGRAATEAWLENKLSRPETFDLASIQMQLDELVSGNGQTYFEIVLEIFADHEPHVRLELC